MNLGISWVDPSQQGKWESLHHNHSINTPFEGRGPRIETKLILKKTLCKCFKGCIEHISWALRINTVNHALMWDTE